VFFGPPDIADFRARFGVPDEWTPIARSRSAILTWPPIQFRPHAPASASPSLNWSTAAGNGPSRDLYATSVKPFRSVSPSKAGTARRSAGSGAAQRRRLTSTRRKAQTRTEDQEDPRNDQSPDAGCRPDLGFCCGAGDGNRTRTVSLGICAIRAVMRPGLRSRVSASDRERPLLAGVNGPLMAR
jgi:hypothetical protein